jgi:hypothetical protein
VPLQNMILAESKTLEGRISALLQDWENHKPIQGASVAFFASFSTEYCLQWSGNLAMGHVVGVLSAFDLKFNKLEEEYRHLNQAKEALALAVTVYQSYVVLRFLFIFS